MEFMNAMLIEINFLNNSLKIAFHFLKQRAVEFNIALKYDSVFWNRFVSEI